MGNPNTLRISFIWRLDSPQMYFTLFMTGMFQAEDEDERIREKRSIRRQNQCTCVTRIEKSRCSWSQGRREFFWVGSRARHVKLISYRLVDCVGIGEMIVFTVRYHSNPPVHILTAFLWHSGIRRQQSYNPYHGRMLTWFCWARGRATICGDEDVPEIEQDISLANVLVALSV